MKDVDNFKKYLDKGIRYDGRALDQFRDIKIETGVSKTAEGSAHIRLGDTELIIGVKLSTGEPYPDSPESGVLTVNAEFLPLSSPDFESGPPGIESIELARVIDRGIRESEAIDYKKLCIEKGIKVWIVSVDICTLNDDGNLIDAAGIGTIVALKDAKFPKFDGTTIDYKEKTNKGLPLTKTPIPVTVYKISDKLFVDPGLDEADNYDSRLTITSIDKNTICALQKGGKKPLTVEEVDEMVVLALKKVPEILKVVEGKK